MSRRAAEFGELVGKTVQAVQGTTESSEEVRILTDAGVFVLTHDQDCCESVLVADVTGDPADLVGAVVRLAEVSTEEGPTDTAEVESSTWTFYRIRTDRGDLDIRWFGQSNGYYSETVDVYFQPTGPRELGW